MAHSQKQNRKKCPARIHYPRIAEVLRRKWEKSGKEQKELAVQLGWARQEVCTLLSIGGITPRRVKLVASVFGVSASYLAALMCDIDAVPPDTNILPLLKKLENESELLFEELEKLLISGTDNPKEKLREIREEKKRQVTGLALSKLNEEERCIIVGQMKQPPRNT